MNTNRFTFPYTIPFRGTVDTAVRSLADQRFIVNKTIDTTDWRFSRSFKGSGSLWEIDVHEVRDGILDNPVGYGFHQVILSHQRDEATAIREFRKVLRTLRNEYGLPRRLNDEAECVIDELRTDTSISRVMERCRVDSLSVMWQWDVSRGYHRITLEMVETNISVDFTVWGGH